MIESVIVGILLILVVLTYITKSSKKEDAVEISTEPTFEEQLKTFTSMTVPQLKQHVNENKDKLNEPMGRVPTRKADLVETSLRIWTQEK